jgi:hypothetical protein
MEATAVPVVIAVMMIAVLMTAVMVIAARSPLAIDVRRRNELRPTIGADLHRPGAFMDEPMMVPHSSTPLSRLVSPPSTHDRM